MMFSVTYNVFKGPKLDAYMFSSVTSASYEDDVVYRIQSLFEVQNVYIVTFSVAHWGI